MPSYRNQSIDLLYKLVDWSLYIVTLAFNELNTIRYQFSDTNISSSPSYYSHKLKRQHSWHLPAQSQQWKHQINEWNLFKINNKDVIYVVLGSLLLTLNSFHTFFLCFHSWIWKSKCRLGNCKLLITLKIAILNS